MTVRDDVRAERSALTESLTTTMGVQAPTAGGGWTAIDLAAHVVAAERTAGMLTFCLRTLPARGLSGPAAQRRKLRRRIRLLRRSFARLVVAPAVPPT